jgi:lipoprotein NlpD
MKDMDCGWTRRLTAALGLCALLGACTVTGTREAPVTDRSTPPPKPAAVPPAVAAPAPAAPAAPVPGRVAGRDGTYTVQAGDTLNSIANSFGRDARELARWNGIDDPSRIRAGQVLRVVPPAGESVAVLPVTPTSPATTRPLDAPGPAPGAGPAPPAATDQATVPGPVASIPETKPAPAAPAADWIWPASGKVVDRFDEKRNKGISIAGKEGDPVVASADGTVVYSGSGLRGYGNLVILKHNDDFISAYAHNKQILVKQGQAVKRGQRIAEVGRTDTNEPKLHFEIRRQGKPVDPLAYLPPR